jgi:glutathione synthase/RimK-type ligase-like ATP-grasp enzyme
MRLGLLARGDDPIANHLGQLAQQAGAEAWVIPLTDVTYGAGRWRVDTLDLGSLDAFVLRQFPGTIAPPPDENCDRDRLWQHALAQRERSELAQSCILALEHIGKPMINSWRATMATEMKAWQLEALRAAAVTVPDTCITRDLPTALGFASGRPCIMKPLSGGAHTRNFDAAVIEHCREQGVLGAAPVILQALVPGVDVRVTLLAGDVLSAVEIPTAHLDYRSDPSYAAGGQTYIQTSLPAAVLDMCSTAQRACGQVFSGIDLRRGPDGFVLLECNSAPVYLDIEHKTGADISARLLRYAMQRARGNVTPADGSPTRRRPLEP